MNVPWGFASFDRVAFGLINGVWTHPVLDRVMPLVTDLHKIPWVVYGIAPAAIAFWLYKERKHALRVLVVAAIAVGACDLLSYRVLKPWAARPRPQYAGIGAIVRAPVGGKLGFPSNHAMNAAAAASVLGVAYPAAGIVFWGGAGLVAYSRVYVGAHYPLDVLVGMAVGAVLGIPWAMLMLGGGAGGGSGGGKKKKKKG
ncbi:MAG: phosphatase PAP2 family protein [Elusimicrobiota bacterium]|nr:phosphatase PAP2 family protein [Elusimicrobiota bacterium]